MVSSRKICREYGPALTPNAAPGLCTSVSLAQSPNTSRGTCCGTRSATASAVVAKSAKTIEVDLLATAVAPPERLRRPVEPAKRFVDVPEESTFRAREEERLLALHG